MPEHAPAPATPLCGWCRVATHSLSGERYRCPSCQRIYGVASIGARVPEEDVAREQRERPTTPGMELHTVWPLVLSPEQSGRLGLLAERMGLQPADLAQRLLEAGITGYLCDRETEWDVIDWRLTPRAVTVRRVTCRLVAKEG